MNQASKNLYTNIINLIVNIAIGLLYTPYLVRSLGIEAYGVIPLALMINQYINILSFSMSVAIARFYSVEYRAGNFQKASVYFSTAVIASVLLFVILYPFLFILILNLDNLFNIPESLLSDAKTLFGLTIMSFFISVTSNCINVTLIADNYLDYTNILKISRHLLKFVANILFFIIFERSIVYVGYATLFSEVFVLFLSILFYSRKKPGKIKFKWSTFDKASLLVMLSMIMWMIIQSLSNTFIYKIDALFMNIGFGMKFTGIIGAISEFGNYAVSFTTIISSLITPLLLISYSKKLVDKYAGITIQGGYLVALICSLFCGLLVGSADLILKLWLGQEYEGYGVWMIIKLVVIPYTTFGAIYANSYSTANYMKRPALTSLIISLLNVICVLIFLHYIKSVIGFLLVCLLFVMSQGFIMNIFYFNRLYPGHRFITFVNTLKFTLFFIIVSGFTWFITNIIEVNNITVLLSIYFVIGIIMILLMDLIFIPSDYRAFMYELIPIYAQIRNRLIVLFKR